MRRLGTIGLLALILCVAACKKETVQTPPQAPETKLKQILQSPEAYQGKRILLNGHFANVCCAGCFTYKEGVDSLGIVTMVKGWEKFASGTRIQIVGIVHVTKKKAEGDSKLQVHVEAEQVKKR